MRESQHTGYEPLNKNSSWMKFFYNPDSSPRRMIQTDIPIYNFWLSCNHECNTKYGPYCKHFNKMKLREYGSEPSQLIFILKL